VPDVGTRPDAKENDRIAGNPPLEGKLAATRLVWKLDFR
jgi:hypothetical protein